MMGAREATQKPSVQAIAEERAVRDVVQALIEWRKSGKPHKR